MPRLVDDEVFEEVQRRFESNKQRGSEDESRVRGPRRGRPHPLANGEGLLPHVRRADRRRLGHVEDRQDLLAPLLPQSAQNEVLREDPPQG